ncbi:hypothetical protein MEO41_27950, partial [Dolichospermum sp. ST_sed4]|nr:hypothetical protein [Dolichospermum sp. ST_sed4]
HVDINRIIDILIQHGADTDIAVDTHPHIGSNRLPKLVAAIRQTILDNGGEIYFNSRVEDFILKGNEIVGVRVSSGDEFLGDALILATGHSARDIFYLLNKKKIRIDPKPFAMGVRIDHPQELTNPEFANGEFLFDRDIPFTTISPGAVAAGTIIPPGHIQNEYTPLSSTSVTR